MTATPSNLRLTCGPARVSGRTTSLSKIHTTENVPNALLFDFSSSFLQTGAHAVHEPPPSAGGGHSPPVDWPPKALEFPGAAAVAVPQVQNGTEAKKRKIVNTSRSDFVRVGITAVEQQEDGTEEETLTLTQTQLSLPKCAPCWKQQLVFQVYLSVPPGMPWRRSKGVRCLWLFWVWLHKNHLHQQGMELCSFCQNKWKICTADWKSV